MQVILCLLALKKNLIFYIISIEIFAANLFDEATLLMDQNKYKEACEVYMQGIFLGRKVVQQLMEQHDGANDDPNLAMDWIVQSYLACSKARIELGDWETARSDAWAACTYSHNRNIDALKSMLSVNENTNDAIGELQTLNLILGLLKDGIIEEQTMSLQDVETRISALEQKLEEMYKR